MLPYNYGGIIIQGETASSCKHNSFMGFRYGRDLFVDLAGVQCQAESGIINTLRSGEQRCMGNKSPL